jgi:hypothetical protein
MFSARPYFRWKRVEKRVAFPCFVRHFRSGWRMMTRHWLWSNWNQDKWDPGAETLHHKLQWSPYNVITSCGTVICHTRAGHQMGPADCDGDPTPRPSRLLDACCKWGQAFWKMNVVLRVTCMLNTFKPCRRYSSRCSRSACPDLLFCIDARDRLFTHTYRPSKIDR